ncbi:MAG: flavin reductase family protein [Hyphomicrobiales bacterium]|nr:flavin reductase family protein [Hyphomicrobiales bacterium]
MIFYLPEARDRALLPHDPMKALIAPRPIGWISTMDRDGRVNLAPYSFFNQFGSAPPIVGFSSETEKDSAAFAATTGEFTWSLATLALKDAMNATSAALPRGASEFEHAGLEAAPSRVVKPPRVARSPAALECKVVDVIALKDVAGRRTGAVLTLGQVVGVHLDEDYVRGGRFDTARAAPLARCGYMDYAVADRLFELDRPA